VETKRIILSYGMWHQMYGGDQAVSRNELQLNGRPFTIVGVMPPGFVFIGSRGPAVGTAGLSRPTRKQSITATIGIASGTSNQELALARRRLRSTASMLRISISSPR